MIVDWRSWLQTWWRNASKVIAIAWFRLGTHRHRSFADDRERLRPSNICAVKMLRISRHAAIIRPQGQLGKPHEQGDFWSNFSSALAVCGVYVGEDASGATETVPGYPCSRTPCLKHHEPSSNHTFGPQCFEFAPSSSSYQTNRPRISRTKNAHPWPCFDLFETHTLPSLGL